MADQEHQEEIVAQGRPMLGIVVSAIALFGLGFLVFSSGQPDEEASSSELPTSTIAPPSATTDSPAGPVTAPSIDGVLVGGAAFEVYERTPGVLCATIDNSAPDASPAETGEICHHELVTASGAAVIDTRLTFGYLPPGAASASLRYRTSGIGNEGIRVEQDAQFFALPIVGDDPYRLQYRTPSFAIAAEVPLVAYSGGAAQSATDATAQGVPPSVAALSFNRRVQVMEEWTRFSEGPYVWSSLPVPSVEPGWAELLHLDATGTKIIRAVPLPNVRLNAVLGTPDALYLIGQQVLTLDQIAVDRGEIRFPIVVARIERQTTTNTTADATIRVFPQPPIGDEPAIAADVSQSGWQMGPELPPIYPYAIAGVGGFIQIEGGGSQGAPILLDPVSLLPTAT